MGRLPPSLQIHQKFISIWNNSYRTSSESWQKTPDFQKGKPISLEEGKSKDEDKKREGFQDGNLHFSEGVVKE